MSNKTFGILLAVAFVVRIAGIWVPQLWYDENFTLILARLPFDRMIAATAGDVHPPLWYVIEWLFIRLFPDPGLIPAWTLRIPAFVFSLLAFVVFRDVLNVLHVPGRVQVIALALMALLPMQIWYAQEARMYSLFEFEVLVALLFALRANYIGLFVASVAMLYTQNYAAFYLPCIWLVVVIEMSAQYHMAAMTHFALKEWYSKTIIRTTYTLCLALIIFLPWVNVIASQMTTINGRYWIQEQSFGDVLNTVYKLFWTSAMPSFGLFSALMVTFMAVSLGVLHLVYSKHSDTRTILVMAFVPLFMAWVVSVVWQPILLFRPLIGSAPFLYVIVAWCVEKLFEAEQFKSWREAALASALVLPVMVSGLGGYYLHIPEMKSSGELASLNDALVYVRAHWRAGDVIYYTDDGPMVNLSPYVSDLPQYEMPVCGGRVNSAPVLGSLSAATRAAIGIPIAELHELDFERAWVFAPRSPLHPQCYEDQIAPLTLGEPLIVVDDNEFISSGVWLVEK